MSLNKTALFFGFFLLNLAILKAGGETWTDFNSVTLNGRNVFPGKWNNTNNSATLSFQKPSGSTANNYQVRLRMISIDTTVFYPPDPPGTHTWIMSSNTLNSGTNEITVNGASGMYWTGSSYAAYKGNIENAAQDASGNSYWSDGQSFQFLIVTRYGSTPIDTIYSNTTFEIHEEDGAANRGGSRSLSLTDDTDSGNSNSDNVTNVNTISFDVEGTFQEGDSIYIWADYEPDEGWSANIDDIYFLTATPLSSGQASNSILPLGPITTPLQEGGIYNGNEGFPDRNYRFYYTIVDANGNEFHAAWIDVVYDATAPTAPNTPTLTSGSDTGFSNSDLYTSDQTPTFNVTSSEGHRDSHVIILVDGVVIDSVTNVDDTILNENVTISASNSLSGDPSNIYQITAKVRDDAGNLSDASATALEITIDSIPPANPGKPDLQSDSDTGISNSDENTNSTTPIFDVKSNVAVGDSIYLLFTNDDTVGRGEVADGATAISLQASGFNISTSLDGSTYSVSIGAMDRAGNIPSANSNPLSVIVDTTRPATPNIPILYSNDDSGFSNSDNLTNETSPQITVSGVRVNEVVRLYIGAVTLIDTANATSVTFTLTSPLSEGTYSVTATSEDQAGNISNSTNSLILRIDTQGPNAPTGVDMFADDDTGESSQDNNTSNRQPRFIIRGVTLGDSVYLKFDSDVKARDVATADSIELQPYTQIPAGTFNVTAVAVDSAGNVSVPTGALDVTIDFTASIPDSLYLKASSDKGRYNNDNITSDSTVVFVVTGVNPGDSVFVKFSGGTYGTGSVVGRKRVATGQNSVEVTVTDIAAGTYSVNAYTTDLAGNTGGNSPTITGFTIDTTPPPAPSTPLLVDTSDTGISTSDKLTNRTKPTFTVSGVSDADPDSVILRFNSDIVAAGIVTTGTSLTLTPSSDQPENTYSVTAIAIDLAGNLSSVSPSLTVRIDTTAPNPPLAPDLLAADDSGFDDSDNYTNETQPSFILNGLSSTLDSVEIYFSGYSQPRKKAVISHINTDTLQIDNPVSASTYSVTVVAIDSAGNISGSSPALTNLIIDVSAPATPDSIKLKPDSDSGTDNSDNRTNNITPVFTVYGVTTGDSVYVVNVTENDTVGSEKAAASAVDIAINPVSQGDGTYIFKAYAEDPAGNTSSVSASSSETVTIDTTAPPAPVIKLHSNSDLGMNLTDRLTNDRTPTFIISNIETLYDSVYLVIGTDTVADGEATSTNNFLLTSETTLNDNMIGYSVRALIRDYAGNLSTSSTVITVRIDSTAPDKPGFPNLLEVYNTGFQNDDNITNSDTLGLRISGLTNNDSVTLFVDNLYTPFTGVYGNTSAAAIVSDGFVDILYIPTAGSKIIQFAVTVTDSAGNTSEVSSTLTVNRDQDKPPPPDPPILVDASDTGSDNNDNLTRDNTPEFLITGAIVGDSIYLRLGDQRIVGGVAASTSLTLTTGTLDTSGALIFSVIAVDSAGNVSEASGPLTITLDTSAPDVSGVAIDLQSNSDTGISTGDNLTNDTTPAFVISNLSGTDSNPDTLYLVVGTDTTARGEIQGNSVILTSDDLVHSPTPYNVTILVKDKAGNLSSASSSLNLRIDTVPPSEPNPPDLQTEYDFGFSSTDNITNSVDSSGWLAFILTGLSNTSRDSVVLLTDNTIQEKMVISQTLRDTLRTVGIPSGNYDFAIFAIDSAGNISDTSSVLSVVVDNNPPTTPTLPIMTAATDNGSSASDGITNESQPAFSASNVEAGSIMRLFSINTLGDTTQLVVDTVAAGSNTITLTPEAPLSDGTYNMYFVSEDTAGNTATSDVNYGFIIDTNLPTVAISLDPDSLAKEGDVTRVWATFDELVYNPEIYVAFAGGGVEDTTAMTQYTMNDSIWYYDLTVPSGNDGTATISLIGIDIPGNDITNANTTGRNTLRLDNTRPVLTELAPDSGEYVNHTQVSYRLSETVESGSIIWTQIGGTADPQSPHTQALTSTELQGNFSFSDITLTNNPNLVSGATYRITWAVTDTAGNTSQSFIATPVRYDTTAPTGTLTYSHYYAAEDTIVTITATFLERMLPTPLISVDYTGIGSDLTDQIMTMGTDSTIWTYNITIPPGQGVNGVVTMSITGTDLALNSLPQVNLANRDTLVVDNTPPSVNLVYTNLSQPALQFLEGKGGDTVQVAATFSESMSLTPAPKLNVQYADSTVDSFTGMSEDSVTNNTWFYNVVLPTGTINSGLMTVSISAQDPAGNAVGITTNDYVFTVDNTPPDPFATGSVVPLGGNPVVGWLNGITDSVQVMVPIPAISSDTTILYGGRVEIQMIDPSTMLNWASIGTTDSITVAGSSQPFYRPDTAITQALSPNLVEGDTILVRAALYDRVGNRTIGDTSSAILVYDPTPPTLGAITGGNIFSQDTLISIDSITVAWSTFSEQTSGLQRYELAVATVGGDSINDFMDWTSNSVTEAATLVLPLVHDSTYQVHIRALDVAGNISDTLSSSVFRRINTAPLITTIDSTIALEDIPYSDTVSVVDPDLATLLGDEFRYYLTTVRIVGQPAVGAADIDSLTGIITWTPTQDDTGSYQLTVRVNDQWGFADTLLFPLTVLAVNDTPVVSILSPDDNITFAEDHTDTVKMNLTQYSHDVDNDSTVLSWAAVVLDTAAKPGFPTAYLFFGPGLPQVSKQALEQQFLPKPKRTIPKKKHSEITRVHKTLKSMVFKSMITVTIDTLNGISTATFDADSDYYGADHRIIFFASDPAGAMSSDTILLTITPENDPPVWQPITLQEVIENDSMKMDFANFVYDVDDTLLTFKVAALTNSNWMSIKALSSGSATIGDTVIYTSHNYGDTVVFTPAIEWSDSALIQIVALDEQNASDTTLFVIDVLRVPRPHLSIEVVQNNAFTNYFEVVVTDSAEKVDSLSLEVQSQVIPLDTVANYTYVGHYEFSDPGNYNFVAYARGVVGDTIVFRNLFMTLAKANQRWWGMSPDGNFEIMGGPGAVLFDQPLLIADSTMFRARFRDQASYLVGNETMKFLDPVEVSIYSYDENLAIYQRKGIEWRELPSLTEDGRILAYTDGMGYFRTGVKTLIVPGRTSLHQNYPNPFNPVTNIVYDVGFMDGPKQKVNISVFNLLGQQVITLVDDYRQIGRYTIRWDGRNQRGIPVSTGLYFVRLMTNQGRINTKKIMLLR